MQLEKLLNDPNFKKNYCTVEKLAALSQLSASAIAHYLELGLLPYIRFSQETPKYFPKQKCQKRLAEIIQLSKQGKTTEQLQRIFREDVENHRMYKNFWPEFNDGRAA